MAKAKTPAKKPAPKKPAAKKPAAKPKPEKKPVVPSKIVLKVLKAGHKMTERKLRTITDKKGVSAFLVNYPFSFFLETEGLHDVLMGDIESLACPPGYEADNVGLTPFAIGANRSLTVKVTATIAPKTPEPTPEPPPGGGETVPDTSVPVTGDPLRNGADADHDDTKLAPPEEKKAESVDDFEPVAAEVHTDDREVRATFDCQEWLKQASDDDILNLAREQYEYDATSDAVALFMKDKDEKVKEVFAHHDAVNEKRDKNDEKMGFGCRVDEAQALNWVEKFRPHLMEKLAEIKDGQDEPDAEKPAA